MTDGVNVVELAAQLRDLVARPLMLTVEDLAGELRCSVSSAKKLLKDGTIPSVKVEGLRRVRRADAEAYVAGLQPSLPEPREAA